MMIDRAIWAVITKDVGKPLFEAESLTDLLIATSDCVVGHRFLVEECNTLHQYISTDSLMINDKKRGFLMDLGKAVKITHPDDHLLGAGKRHLY